MKNLFKKIKSEFWLQRLYCSTSQQTLIMGIIAMIFVVVNKLERARYAWFINAMNI